MKKTTFTKQFRAEMIVDRINSLYCTYGKLKELRELQNKNEYDYSLLEALCSIRLQVNNLHDELKPLNIDYYFNNETHKWELK